MSQKEEITPPSSSPAPRNRSLEDGAAIRFSCLEAPKSRAAQRQELVELAAVRQQQLEEIALFPAVLQQTLSLASGKRSFAGRKQLVAALQTTEQLWEKQHTTRWSESYSCRLSANQSLVCAALARAPRLRQDHHQFIKELKSSVLALRSTVDAIDRAQSKTEKNTLRHSLESSTLLPIQSIRRSLEKIEKLETLIIEYRNRLTVTNLRFAAAIAKKKSTSRPGAPALDDLFQEGAIGLMAALERFDPRREVAVPTYADHRIRREIQKLFRRSSHVPVPKDSQAAVAKFLKQREALTKRLGRSPSAEEVAKSAKVNLATVRPWLTIVHTLNTSPHRVAGERSYEYRDPHQSSSDTPELRSDDSLGNRVERVFDGHPSLLEAFREMLRCPPGTRISFQAVADAIGVSRERVRQRYEQGIAMLTDHAIIRSCPNHFRLQVAARALRPFECALIQNLLAESYSPLSRRQIIDDKSREACGSDQQRALRTLAVAITLSQMGSINAHRFLKQFSEQDLRQEALSAIERELLLRRLFQTAESWEATEEFLKEYKSLSARSKSAQSPRRPGAPHLLFRDAAGRLAEHARQEWRQQFGTDR